MGKCSSHNVEKVALQSRSNNDTFPSVNVRNSFVYFYAVKSGTSPAPSKVTLGWLLGGFVVTLYELLCPDPWLHCMLYCINLFSTHLSRQERRRIKFSHQTNLSKKTGVQQLYQVDRCCITSILILHYVSQFTHSVSGC